MILVRQVPFHGCFRSDFFLSSGSDSGSSNIRNACRASRGLEGPIINSPVDSASLCRYDDEYCSEACGAEKAASGYPRCQVWVERRSSGPVCSLTWSLSEVTLTRTLDLFPRFGLLVSTYMGHTGPTPIFHTGLSVVWRGARAQHTKTAVPRR